MRAWWHANLISTGAATRREAVNRLSEFLSWSKLLGVEFINTNKRIGTSVLKGWVGGSVVRYRANLLLVILAAAQRPPVSCLCCSESSDPQQAESTRQKFCLSCIFFSIPCSAEGIKKKTKTYSCCWSLITLKTNLALQNRLHSQRDGKAGVMKKAFRFSLDAQMSLGWGFLYFADVIIF